MNGLCGLKRFELAGLESMGVWDDYGGRWASVQAEELTVFLSCSSRSAVAAELKFVLAAARYCRTIPINAVLPLARADTHRGRGTSRARERTHALRFYCSSQMEF